MAALLAVFGIVLGWRVGQVWGERASSDRGYWLRNLAAVLAGGVLSALVVASGLVTLVGLGAGLLGGVVAGLKAGYGKSVGAWRRHDDALGVNRDQVAAAEASKRARESGMSEPEMAGRDLVSVQGEGRGGAAADGPGKEKGRRRRDGRR